MGFIGVTEPPPGCSPWPSLLPAPWSPARRLPGETGSRLLSHPGVKWQKGGEPLLSTGSSVTNSFDLIMWRWETKPDIWLNWGNNKKKKKGKTKSAFCEGYAFERLNRLKSLGSWLSRAAANLFLGQGKSSRSSSAGHRSTTRGWDPMRQKALSHPCSCCKRKTPDNSGTPIKQPYRWLWAPQNSPTWMHQSLPVSTSPSCRRERQYLWSRCPFAAGARALRTSWARWTVGPTWLEEASWKSFYLSKT